MFHEFVSQITNKYFPFILFSSKQSSSTALMSIFLTSFWNMFLVAYSAMSRSQFSFMFYCLAIIAPGGFIVFVPMSLGVRYELDDIV